MKDEWYGDKRDLVKWGVLLHLAAKFKASQILQVPYYRQSEWCALEIDGQPHPLPEAVLKHFRAIGNIGKLKGKCRIRVVGTPFNDRRKYGEVVRRAIIALRGSRSIVFLDPDTGLAPRNPDLKHVLDSELSAVWKDMHPGDVLVFYQHQTNRNGEPWIDPERQQFEAALGLPAGASKLAHAPDLARDVVFFFCQKETQGTRPAHAMKARRRSQ